MAPVDGVASPLFSLRGRVAIVTGAAGLLGREFAESLQDAGADVVVADVDARASEARAAELTKRGDRAALGIGLDVTSRASLVELRDAVLRRFDRLDILINSAALNDRFEVNDERAAELSRFENFPLEQWQRSLDVNLTGTFLACQVLGAEMARRRTGTIINIASTYGMVAPDQRVYRRADGTQVFWKSPVYAAGKAGILGLTRFLATYWASDGVRVNALSPGGVEQGQDEHFQKAYGSRTPLGRMAKPAELRGAAVYLASDASSYMTGANLVVDGGWTAW